MRGYGPQQQQLSPGDYAYGSNDWHHRGGASAYDYQQYPGYHSPQPHQAHQSHSAQYAQQQLRERERDQRELDRERERDRDRERESKEEEAIAKTKEAFSSRRQVRRQDTGRKIKKESSQPPAVSQGTVQDNVKQSAGKDQSDGLDDSDDSDDSDDEIVVSKRKVVNDSEDETDHGGDDDAEDDNEEDLPLPSKKTKKLHRLLRRGSAEGPFNSADEGEDEDEDEKDKPKNEGRDETAQSKRAKPVPAPKRTTSRTTRDASGRTPLQKACKRGNLDLVKELLSSGSNVNDADFAGVTPLHEAALNDYPEILQLLIDNGANVNAQTGQYDKDTALIDAASNLNVECVEILLANGANPLLVNVQGDTPLDVLANDDEFDAEDNDKVKRIRKMLATAIKEAKPPIDSRVEDQDSSHNVNANNQFYDLVSKDGRKEIYDRVAANDVSYVMQYFSSMDKKCPKDLLIVACKYGYGELASLLIAFNADVNYSDNKGWTPLMYSVGKAHKDVVQLLLNNKANAKAKNKMGKTALDILNQSELFDEEEAQLLQNAMGNAFKKRRLSNSRTNSSENVKKPKTKKEVEPGSASENEAEPEKQAEDKDESIQEADDETKPELTQVKEESEAPAPAPPAPTEEELIAQREAQRLRDLESQKARESLEQQRLERKKLKELEIAKKIEALEKERQAEREAIVQRELAIKREEELRIQQKINEENKLKRMELHRLEMEKRKFIRSYYPYGLQLATFDGADLEMAKQYGPYYRINENYMLDVQVCLMFGTEELYSKFPNLDSSKRLLTIVEKDNIWNLMWPIIGSYNKRAFKSVGELLSVYHEERLKFRELQVHFLPLDTVLAEINQNQSLTAIRPMMDQIKPIQVDLSRANFPTAALRRGAASTPMSPGKSLNESLNKTKTPIW